MVTNDSVGLLIDKLVRTVKMEFIRVYYYYPLKSDLRVERDPAISFVNQSSLQN